MYTSGYELETKKKEEWNGYKYIWKELWKSFEGKDQNASGVKRRNE